MGLASIFHDNQVVAARQLQNRIHVRALTINVHRNNGRHRSAIFSVIRFSRLAIHVAFALEIFAQILHVHRVRLLVNINEIRPRAGLTDRFSRGNKGVRYGNNDIPRLHSRRYQREAHCVGTAGDSHAVFRVTETRRIRFQNFRPSARRRNRPSGALFETRQ